MTRNPFHISFVRIFTEHTSLKTDNGFQMCAAEPWLCRGPQVVVRVQQVSSKTQSPAPPPPYFPISYNICGLVVEQLSA